MPYLARQARHYSHQNGSNGESVSNQDREGKAMTDQEYQQATREYDADKMFTPGQFYADRLGYLRCAECAKARYIETGELMQRHETGSDQCDFCENAEYRRRRFPTALTASAVGRKGWYGNAGSIGRLSRAQ